MRLHRVHTDQVLDPGKEARIVGNPAHYLRRVLRVTTGQSIILFNGDGHDYAAEVLRPGKNEIVLAVTARLPVLKESTLRVTVSQAISRGDRMDQTLQKCTELGAAIFQPFFSERVEVRLRPEKLGKRLEHWQAVVVSACEQCGRAVIPEVLPPLSFSDWLSSEFEGSGMVLVPGAEVPLAAMEISDRLNLVVGPEGGFTETELELMMNRGILPVSMGVRILRTETAGPAAVSIVQALFGDLR